MFFGDGPASSQDRKWGERVKKTEVRLDLTQPLDDAYWHLMELAGEYAYAGDGAGGQPQLRVEGTARWARMPMARRRTRS